MPKVEAGEITQEEALKQAGYADSTARQQTTVLGSLRQNTKMQEALKKAGFTEDYLAEGIVQGTKAIDGSMKVVRVLVDAAGEQLDEEIEIRAKPDYRARGIYYKLGAELMDAFPAKVNLNADVTVDDLIKEQEASASSHE